MSERIFLSAGDIVRIHDDMVERYGGLRGIRDENALGSAVQRPDDKSYYEPDASLPELAASLAYGLAKNHAFNDANKRASLAAMSVFLNLNGFELDAEADVVIETWVALAAGRLSEAELAAWIAAHLAAFSDARE
ncbi:type II toxin-antitoxin system death-on-curing family toxin [Aureimonas mangrovi]|uniref:type II toxin-antitoxin system death-on-curing family toxin n=1 Tax=Aureimonas mangrovi TaxID=2758041 RepID=UPI001AED14C4|nr:type II toxin-antitoxin system death-on-curing family toxin [Aureimonas mangrovi]